MEWCAQGHDFRTFLGDFLASLPQFDIPGELSLYQVSEPGPVRKATFRTSQDLSARCDICAFKTKPNNVDQAWHVFRGKLSCSLGGLPSEPSGLRNVPNEEQVIVRGRGDLTAGFMGSAV
jgi:hypothetical protein